MRVRTHIIYIYLWEERGRRNFCAKMSISRNNITNEKIII